MYLSLLFPFNKHPCPFLKKHSGSLSSDRRWWRWQAGFPCPSPGPVCRQPGEHRQVPQTLPELRVPRGTACPPSLRDQLVSLWAPGLQARAAAGRCRRALDEPRAAVFHGFPESRARPLWAQRLWE